MHLEYVQIPCDGPGLTPNTLVGKVTDGMLPQPLTKKSTGRTTTATKRRIRDIP
jgi:hypothetical protein